MLQRHNSYEVFIPENPLPERLSRYRRERKFVDITIKVGEQQFPAHRMVLEDASSALKALLSSGPSPENVYVLDNRFMESHIMEQLLYFLYTSRLTFGSVENAEAICKAAHYLKLSGLLSASENYLIKKIGPHNAVRMYFFAGRLHLQSLQNSCHNYMIEHCEKVLANSALNNLSVEEFQSIFSELRRHKRNPRMKEALCEAIIMWIGHDQSRRLALLPSLLKDIPFQELPIKYMDEITMFCDKNSPYIVEITGKEALKYFQSSYSKFLLKYLRKFISCHLYCFGGRDQNQRTLSYVSHFDISTGKWSNSTRMLSNKSHFSGAVIGSKIYLCGGIKKNLLSLSSDETPSRNMEVFDCSKSTWTQLEPMPGPRCQCAAAALNGFVYVTGGKKDSKESLDSVIRYNIQTSRWEPVKSLNLGRVGHQLVELNGRLYAISGKDTNTVEEYSPSTNEWRMVASTQYNHRFFGATSFNGKVYVCSRNGFEMFSPESNTWNILTPLDDFRGRTLVAIVGQIWAIGGGKDDREGTPTIFSFDTATGQWAQLPDMDVARIDHCSFVVNFENVSAQTPTGGARRSIFEFY